MGTTLVLLTLLAGATTASSTRAKAAAPAAPPGPYVTFLFSRSEITAADGCQAVDAGVARLDTAVAPYLASQGFVGVGSLVTGKTAATTRTCTHSRSTMTASWADATGLADEWGWSFVSHTATYPKSMDGLTQAQAAAETCGSARTLEAHGLPGARGLIAYPGAQGLPTGVQTQFGSTCFAWGRRYQATGTTLRSAATTPPYWQTTKALNGGPCNVRTSSCYTIAATGSKRYDLPTTILARVQAVRPGQWLTVQAYVLVTGRSPTYSKSPVRWDCTSADPRLHWTNDNERYCYADWQQVVAAVAARADIEVTDPLTVGVAFGRPPTY